MKISLQLTVIKLCKHTFYTFSHLSGSCVYKRTLTHSSRKKISKNFESKGEFIKIAYTHMLKNNVCKKNSSLNIVLILFGNL